jgi:hypothetical protein
VSEIPPAKCAVFVQTHNEALLSDQMLELLRGAPASNYDIFLVINSEGTSQERRIYVPNSSIFERVSNKSNEGRIIPGNADLVLLEAFRQAEDYESYLLIEYDVFYNGEIRRLIKHIFEKYAGWDLVAPYVRGYKGNEQWMWWSSLVCVGVEIFPEDRLYSFLQFVLYSRRALKVLQEAVSAGWSGHHEVLHATLFSHSGLKVGAFQQDEMLKFDTNTFRAVPPRLIGHEGYLHHPVKGLIGANLARQISLSDTVRNIDAHRASARAILSDALRLTGACSVIDVGCGLGIWLEVARSLGATDILGIDGPWLDQLPLYVGKESILLHDLTTPLGIDRRFDICLCLEVLHQVGKEGSDRVVDLLATLSDIIVFSAATPFQGDFGQVNGQWPSFWCEKFRARDYQVLDIFRPKHWRNNQVLWRIRQNTLLFVRRSAIGRLVGLTSSTTNTGPLDLVHPDFLIEYVQEARPADNPYTNAR